MTLDARTKLIGLFGNPVEHSFSPLFMNYALDALNLNYRYLAFSIERDNLEVAVDSLRTLGLRGVNVTIPYKNSIMGSLDTVDKGARLIGAVNCIVNGEGRLSGYNTDAHGFIKPLKDHGISPAGKRVLIIGSGGAARSVMYGLVCERAAEINLANRTESRAVSLIKWCNTTLRYREAAFRGPGRELSQKEMDRYEIIVNATPVGMHPDRAGCPVGKNIGFHSHQVVYDLIYNPPQTELLRRGEEVHAHTLNGFDMLIIQGLCSLALWFPALKEDIFSLQQNIIDHVKSSAGYT
jgi:shikimate dehydrogenase